MPVSISSDPAALTLTAIGEYSVPVERLWSAWADPRQLERFWGPPVWPATFTRHDMTPGGRSEYYMSGPNGETSAGFWIFDSVEEGRRFAIRDGFVGPDGNPNEDLPQTTMEVSFEATANGSRFVSVSRFPSVEAMEKLVAMGMVEGLTCALAQLEPLLEDLRDHSATFTTDLETLDATRVSITRDLRGSMPQVWRAHHEAELLKKWMLGPPGWTMPVCEVAAGVGDSFRYVWESTEEGQSFGFEGEVLEREAPRREVSTERMIGLDAPGTHNEMVLSPLPGGRTRLQLTITYASEEQRDAVLGTGMVDGMEASYARLESLVAS